MRPVQTTDRARLRWMLVPLAALTFFGLAATAQRLPSREPAGSSALSGGPDASASTTLASPPHASVGPATPAPVTPWTVPFLSRPTSGPIFLEDCQDVVIEGKTFQDLGPDVEAIHLENCDNVTIRNNDFARVAQAITATDSTNIRVEWNRYRDIIGPHARVGLNRANFVQFDKVRGGYIGNNKGLGGDTEDIISLHDASGTATEPLYVENNHFEGTNWQSESGSGIALGDGGSSFAIARNNVLLNPGQVGIFIAGGTGNAIIGNVLYGEQRPLSNVGIYVWNQSDSECSGHEVSGNKVHWTRADGEPNASWDQGGCGPVSGWATNDWRQTTDPAQLHVDLDSAAPNTIQK